MYEQQIKEIAERLHGLRDALELTQEQAAEKLGIEAEKYVAYESGNCDIPMSFLYSVAKGFNVDMQTLISGEDTHEVPYSVVRSGKGVVVKRKSPLCLPVAGGNVQERQRKSVPGHCRANEWRRGVLAEHA